MISKDDIPNKKYYKIGEVCTLTGIKPHTLRYWEGEFKLLKPHRANSKQRLYRRVDIENIILIRKMIQDDGLTILGTKKALAKEPKSNKRVSGNYINLLSTIKSELIKIKETIA